MSAFDRDDQCGPGGHGGCQADLRFEAWRHDDGDQQTHWSGYLELSNEFYETLRHHAVPLDYRALSALKHSALALDVYI